MTLLRSFGFSDVGKRREINEDSFLHDDVLGFYIVADGVGGQAKGELASAQTVEEAHGFIHRGQDQIAAYARDPSPEHLFQLRRLTESAIQAACYMVFGLAEQDPARLGMSTTVSALLLVARVGIMAQVGDSRIYHLRGGRLRQLTEDHTLLNYKLKRGLITPEEAERAPGKNVITRAVGHRDYVQVDTSVLEVEAGDRFLLCSDGLHIYLPEHELPDLLAPPDPREVAQALVDLANARGGQDNITALVVDLE